MHRQHSTFNEHYQIRKEFRYFSRLVKLTPANEHYHRKRIQAAMRLEQNEPLQGALADYFYACWYLMSTQGNQLLKEVSARLQAWVLEEFHRLVGQGYCLPSITKLATRWSVLASPSMDMPSHQMYVGKDDASWVAKDVCKQLLAAKVANQQQHIEQIEHEFFAHCMACQDRMGFLMVWFELAKQGWVFHDGWAVCKQALTQTPAE